MFLQINHKTINDYQLSGTQYKQFAPLDAMDARTLATCMNETEAHPALPRTPVDLGSVAYKPIPT
jgi:hypothetical protein